MWVQTGESRWMFALASRKAATFFPRRPIIIPSPGLSSRTECSFWSSEPIFDHVVGIILVFSQIIPRSAFNFFPVHCKQLGPWIFSSRSPVARHHCRYGAECNAVTAIAGSNELPLGILANVRQAVGRGDDLSRPTMIYTRLWNYFFQASEQARISSLRVALLACLVILPAEHDVIKAASFINSQVIVRISRIPKTPSGIVPIGTWAPNA